MTEQQDLLTKYKVSPKELEMLLKHKDGPRHVDKPYKLGGRKISMLAITDSHCGHQAYDPRVMDLAAKVAKTCDFAIHAGDIVEGHYEHKRPGHVFELTHVGGDAQVNYAASELRKLQIPLYFIAGNHCNTFMKIAGFDIGKRLEELIPKSTYLGMQHGTLEFDYGKRLQLIHPDGGSSYAISYKTQKIIDAMEGGSKPEILVIGNFHKAEYLFYRNIHAVQGGCLERQTPFMKNLGLAAHVGFWKFDITLNKKGITSFRPTFFPSY